MKPREQAIFDRIVSAACSGLRCPMNDELGSTAKCLGMLARAGYLRIEVYSRNYRVVEIMDGPHAGKRTAEEPSRAKPYRIIDKNGDRWLSRAATTLQPVMKHKDHLVDRNRPAAAITLPRLSFLDGEG